MNSIDLIDTLILTTNDFSLIFDNQQRPYLTNYDINDYNYIVGPYIIDKNHWIAIIIDIITCDVYFLDPKGYN